eukprot:g4233.t1
MSSTFALAFALGLVYGMTGFCATAQHAYTLTETVRHENEEHMIPEETNEDTRVKGKGSKEFERVWREHKFHLYRYEYNRLDEDVDGKLNMDELFLPVHWFIDENEDGVIDASELSQKLGPFVDSLKLAEQLIAVVDNDPIDKVLGKEELRDFMLDKLDLDGDKHLDQTELRNFDDETWEAAHFMETWISINALDFGGKHIFMAVDGDGNGELTWQEMRNGHGPGNFRSMRRKYDNDRSKALSLEELKNVPCHLFMTAGSKLDMKKDFALAQHKKKNSMTLEEFVVMHQRDFSGIVRYSLCSQGRVDEPPSKLFLRFDSNDDGELDEAEFSEAFTSVERLAEQKVKNEIHRTAHLVGLSRKERLRLRTMKKKRSRSIEGNDL